MRKVFVAPVILDVIDQLVMLHKVYLGEASVVAILPASFLACCCARP